MNDTEIKADSFFEAQTAALDLTPSGESRDWVWRDQDGRPHFFSTQTGTVPLKPTNVA